MEDAVTPCLSEAQSAAIARSRETPLDPMEFLSRSWSVSALEVSAAIAAPAPRSLAASGDGIAEEAAAEHDDVAVPSPALVAGNSFSFFSGATSQLVLDRILSQSQEVSPLTSGRLSHSSGPLNGSSLTDSPPVSPTELDDVKYVRAPSAAVKPPQIRAASAGGSRTVGSWLKDRREKKKEEARVHNAQVHAAVSLAGVAAAVAAVAAATAAASGSSSRSDRATRTDMAVASAATLVAAQCFEAAEAIGADRDHLTAVVGSAVNVHSPGDIVTLSAAAATALRGAATLRARALRDVWNVAAVIPVEKGGAGSQLERRHKEAKSPVGALADGGSARLGNELLPQNNFLGICSQELLARGADLLKRTRKGSLHWKFVSVYINKMGQVMLKMKSRHIAGAITKKKKSVVVGVCRDVMAWPGRHLLEGAEHRRYFGLRTAEGRVIEFECRNKREHEMWTQGIARILDLAGEGRRPMSLDL